MFLQYQFSQRVIIPAKSDRFRVTDIVHDLNGGTGIFQTVSFAGKNMPVALRMQIGKTVAELHFLSLYAKRTKCSFPRFLYFRRKSIVINA